MSVYGKSERAEMVQRALGEGRMGPKGWVRAGCPFCVAVSGREDKRWSLGIQAATGFYHCFRCGTAGRVRVDVEDQMGHVYEVEEPEEATEMEPPEGYYPLWEGDALTADASKVVRQYLRKRGFDRSTWKRALLGVTFEGLARYRVIIPVLDVDREMWLGWIARDWTGNAIPKYLYPEGMPRGTLLYQHEVLFEESDDPALVVEGCFDAMPYPGDACACLGKPSRWQRAAFKLSKRPVVVCLDGDAWEEAYALSMQLKMDGVRAGFVRLPPKEDPCSMALKHGPEWLREQARRAI